MFIEYVDETWLFMVDNNGSYTFKPTWITEGLANQYFWRHGNRFVLMSATPPPVHVLSKLLGLSVKDIEYIHVPSSFDPSRRKVVLCNDAANMTYKTFDREIPKLVRLIKKIMAAHPTEKGVIHTTSYKVADYLINHIETDRFITHTGDNKHDVIDMFMRTNKPAVLVSPSADRGLSLDYDKCRFIIWAKAPYLSLSDKMVKSRLYGSGQYGRDWYKFNMLQTVIQGVGRGNRHADDYCTAYICDKQIIKAITSNVTKIPVYFRESLVIA